jgi:hypothetical protein
MALESMIQPITQMRLGIIPGIKGGRGVRLTSPLWDNYLENVGISMSHSPTDLHEALESSFGSFTIETLFIQQTAAH